MLRRFFVTPNHISSTVTAACCFNGCINYTNNTNNNIFSSSSASTSFRFASTKQASKAKQQQQKKPVTVEEKSHDENHPDEQDEHHHHHVAESAPIANDKTIIETTDFTDTKPHNDAKSTGQGTDGESSTPEEVTSFLNQFQYAGAELGLKLSPPDLAVELLEYQKEGVGWMARREHFHSGGIMADFLGMGKTVQMLSLCVARTPNPKQFAADKNKKESKAAAEQRKKDNDEVTQAIVEQQKRVDKMAFATNGEPFKLQTVIQQLLQIPAVMNVSKITMPAKDVFSLQRDLTQIVKDHPTAKEEDIEKRLAVVRKEIDKWLTFAGKYYASWERRARAFLGTDGNANGNGATDPNAADMETPEIRTLVIVPASLVFQWKHEIETKIDQKKRPCKILIYHGSTMRGDSVSAIDLESYDFVITTYESVVRASVAAFRVSPRNGRRTSASQESMGAQMFNRSAAGPLFKVRWKRIILDEAHYVRNEKTTRFRCIQQLMGIKRWAVTATPLHNSIQDLQTLLNFVGQPRLPLVEANEALLLKDPVLQRAIARSLQPAFLRRTPIMTRQGAEHTLLVLPTKDDHVVRGDLTQKEVLLYNDALAKRQSAISFLSGKNFIHIFAMMTLLRQACCHPWLTEGKKSEHQVCFLCNFETLNPLTSRCGHAFCKECLTMAFKAHAGDKEDETVRLPCPACQVPIPFSIFGKTLHLSTSENIARLRKRPWVSSSKMDMLMSSIRNVIENKKTSEEKIVIFAQFTSLLDIVTVAIEKNFPNCNFVRIDGQLNLKARNGLIHSFTFQKDVKILLASKMAMGVGLNLTAANNVIILDPWWNPQVEEQAVHRCHRIGQKKHVVVQRFVMNDTIEQYCWEISRKKKDFGDAVLKAATADENDHYGDGSARTVAQLVVKELRPIGKLPASSTTTTTTTTTTTSMAPPLSTPNQEVQQQKEVVVESSN